MAGFLDIGASTVSGAASGSVAGPWGAVIGGAAGLGAGLLGLNAGDKAAAAQKAAAEQAQKQLEEYYNKAAEYSQPYMQAGSQAAGQLGGMVSRGEFNMPQQDFQYKYQEDPAYRNQLATGNQAVMQNAGAMGNLFSGATMKALQRYGVNMANQNYNQNFERQWNQYNTQYQNNANQKQNEFQRIYNTAGMGQQAAGNLISGQRELGQGIAGLSLQKGNVEASNEMGRAQTLGTMVGSAGRLIGGMIPQKTGMNSQQQEELTNMGFQPSQKGWSWQNPQSTGGY